MFIRVGEGLTVRLVVYWPVINLEASLVLVVGLTVIAVAFRGFRFSSENQHARTSSRFP